MVLVTSPAVYPRLGHIFLLLYVASSIVPFSLAENMKGGVVTLIGLTVQDYVGEVVASETHPMLL